MRESVDMANGCAGVAEEESVLEEGHAHANSMDESISPVTSGDLFSGNEG